MELIYGTNNPSKLQSMIRMLDGLEIEVIGLSAINMPLSEAEESGKEPLCNAKQKALSYYQQIGRPVFSCDSGLYFDGVSEEDQPGVMIKRINGNNFTYKEMLTYYSDMAKKYGGKLVAHYKNAICLVIDEHTLFAYDGEDIHSEKFYLVESPHEKYREGFPLDSISVEIKSSKYYYDLEEEQSDNLSIIQGVRDFFVRSLEGVAKHYK